MAMDDTTVVVDASVVAKWYLPEKHHLKARQLRDRFLDGSVDLTAPSVLPYEVLNALQYSQQFDENQLSLAAETLPRYGIELVPFSQVEKLVSTAYSIENTIFDASYVALAAARAATLYTADQKLIAGTAGTEYETSVRHVRSVPSA